MKKYDVAYLNSRPLGREDSEYNLIIFDSCYRKIEDLTQMNDAQKTVAGLLSIIGNTSDKHPIEVRSFKTEESLLNIKRYVSARFNDTQHIGVWSKSFEQDVLALRFRSLPVAKIFAEELNEGLFFSIPIGYAKKFKSEDSLVGVV